MTPKSRLTHFCKFPLKFWHWKSRILRYSRHCRVPCAQGCFTIVSCSRPSCCIAKTCEIERNWNFMPIYFKLCVHWGSGGGRVWFILDEHIKLAYSSFLDPSYQKSNFQNCKATFVYKKEHWEKPISWLKLGTWVNFHNVKFNRDKKYYSKWKRGIFIPFTSMVIWEKLINCTYRHLYLC